MRSLVLCATAMILAANAASASSASAPGAYVGHELAGHAKLSMAQAEAIALRARPGRVKDRELEEERAGSGLRYSFDIEANGAIYEVGIDARSGKLLENAKEGPHPD